MLDKSVIQSHVTSFQSLGYDVVTLINIGKDGWGKNYLTINYVSDLSSVQEYWPINDIASKILCIPTNTEHNRSFASFPLDLYTMRE